MTKTDENKKGSKGDHPRRSRPGTLFVVATPIGNLQDMTLRAVQVLKNVDLVAAESVTHSRILCRHYGIRTKVTRYNQHNRKTKGLELIGKLKSGWDIAYVTKAGTPCVSDPGAQLVRAAHREGIRVEGVPGPSAVTAALAVSGLPGERFLFVGFLTSRATGRRKELRALKDVPWTLIFFEAPHRVKAMLQDAMEILGDRRVAMIREQTKFYEQVTEGSISSILETLGEGPAKGEFTLVMEGRPKEAPLRPWEEKTRERIKKLLKQGFSVKDIAEKMAGERDGSYRKLYRECLALKKEIDSGNMC